MSQGIFYYVKLVKGFVTVESTEQKMPGCFEMSEGDEQEVRYQG